MEQPPALTLEQKIHLFREGYLVIPNVIEKPKVDAALRLINQELSQGLSEEDMKKASTGTYCPNITNSSEITNLFNGTNVIHYATSAIGPEVKPLFGAQIALRFPGSLCTDKRNFCPVPWWNKMWHVDGFHSDGNGIPKGEIRNFTCLVGIVLSEIPEDFCGNLVVFPRSHHLLEDYFNKSGFDKIKEGLGHFNDIFLPPSIQIKAKPGDIILAHYSLAHSIAPNISPNIRYAVYFRINVRENNIHHPEPMKNIWIDWKGMKEIVLKEKKPVLNNLTSLTPGYVDEQGIIDHKNTLKKDKKLSELTKKAEEIFKRHEWDNGQPLFEELAKEFSNDFWIQFKAGCCYTWGNEKNIFKAESFILKAIEICPVIPNTFTLYAQNLNRQKRYKEVIPMVKKMLNCPCADGKDYFFDGLKVAGEALVNLNQEDKYSEILDLAKEKYPKEKEEINKLPETLVVKSLWKKGKEIIDGPKKDWDKGKEYFAKIIAINPSDYWATFLLGGCYIWGLHKFSEGIPYAKKSIELNKALPHGYLLLVQSYAWGKNKKELEIALEEMFSTEFPEISTNSDHQEKIIEALKCAEQSFGKQSPQFKRFVDKVKAKYPSVISLVQKKFG